CALSGHLRLLIHFHRSPVPFGGSYNVVESYCILKASTLTELLLAGIEPPLYLSKLYFFSLQLTILLDSSRLLSSASYVIA
ncbi:MAG: hypothetical protein ACUVTL_09870, partial [Thermoproteota archaeon]